MTDEPEEALEALTPNDLDELMARDPLGLSKQDIRQIIAYHRKQRARRAKGEKAEKNTAGPKIDLSSIIKSLQKQPETVIKRRI